MWPETRRSAVDLALSPRLNIHAISKNEEWWPGLAQLVWILVPTRAQLAQRVFRFQSESTNQTAKETGHGLDTLKGAMHIIQNMLRGTWVRLFHLFFPFKMLMFSKFNVSSMAWEVPFSRNPERLIVFVKSWLCLDLALASSYYRLQRTTRKRLVRPTALLQYKFYVTLGLPFFLVDSHWASGNRSSMDSEMTLWARRIQELDAENSRDGSFHWRTEFGR